MQSFDKRPMRQNADRLMGILAEVMSENGSDKSSAAYEQFRKLDACLRDGLCVELNRFGLGEGPDVDNLTRQILARVETACRFPELMRQNVVLLVVSYINQAFRGESIGLIEPISEIGAVRTVIPILAVHGEKLKIEYVNYADNRREISLSDYAFLNEWSYRLGGLQLRRLIKNFIITAPQVTNLSALLITAQGGESKGVEMPNLPIVKRLSPFIGKMYYGEKTLRHPFINKSSAYLGLKEQIECVNVIVRGGLWRDEQQARVISRAVAGDLTRLDGGNESEKAFFTRYRDEAETALKRSREQLNVLGPILKTAIEIMDVLRKELNDFFDKNRKRLPQHPDYVTACLCRIVEAYGSTGQKPSEYLARIKTFGIDPDADSRVLRAVEMGRRNHDAHRINTDDLVEEGERKLKVRRIDDPIKPTDVQLVPFKMAAAYGNLTALARLADIFYNAGRYSHNRRLSAAEDIADAQTLKFILGRLVDRGCDVEENRNRILHLRKCLGEFEEEAEPEFKPRQIGKTRKPGGGRRHKGLDLYISDMDDDAELDYSEDMDYRSHRTHVSTTSSDCCFVVTAAIGALSVDAFEQAKAFVLMKRLRDNRMSKTAVGQVLLSTYYKVAPKLVEEINARSNKGECYQMLWERYIVPCCQCVRCGRMEDAEKMYTEMVKRLLFSTLDQINS